jgi:bifunctional DNase/RNase
MSMESENLMPVQMHLSRIIISDIHDQQLIYLKEVDGDRQFPIVIAWYEADSIDCSVKDKRKPRPNAHDLLVKVVEHLDGELESVVVSELRERTYYARLCIRKEGDLLEIDSRPSDAIAIAVRCDPPLPIYVEESILDEVCNSDGA